MIIKSKRIKLTCFRFFDVYFLKMYTKLIKQEICTIKQKILQKLVLILQYRISVLKNEDDSIDLPLQDVKLLKPGKY